MNQLKAWIAAHRHNQADLEFYLRLVETPPQLTPEPELLQFAETEDEIGASFSAGDPKRAIADLLRQAEDAHDELRI